MRVLVACEYSGVVRDAFRKSGHDAWSCDLLETESPGQHYQGDCFDLLAPERYHWDLIILHPPCTCIALCGNSTYGEGMAKHCEREKSIRWTRKLWRTATAQCEKVAMENPKNVMGNYIGKRTQAIQPFQFGHPERKETWFWLQGLPPLAATDDVFTEMMKLPKCQRERLHYLSPSPDRGHLRSRTFQGIAEAMAAQWGNN